MSFLEELKRRNVFRVGIAYAVAAWVLLQMVDVIGDIIEMPDWLGKFILLAVVVGFIPTLIFAWAFELTPEGLKREKDVDRTSSITRQTASKLNIVTLVLMTFAIGYLLLDKFYLSDPGTPLPAEPATELVAEPADPASSVAANITRQSIAVLPFDNRSRKEEDEFFVEGIHDDLLTNLARIGSLKVISRTSVSQYSDTKKSIPEIARELGVATIMEGAVQRSGNTVRINVQLIDANTDEHLWAEIFDREMTADNLFAIQSEISGEIAKALKATLSPEEEKRINERPTENLAAYNAYLRGRQLMARRNSSDMDLAGEELRRAVELDPEFALAWTSLAENATLRSNYSTLSLPESLKIREEAVSRAMALDDQLGEAHLSQAGLHAYFQRYEEADASYRKAIELSPGYALAHMWYSGFLSDFPERTREALQHVERAVELDPLSSIARVERAGIRISLGQFEAAEADLRATLDLDPGFAATYRVMAWVLGNLGRLDEVVEWRWKSIDLDPGRIGSQADLIWAYLDLGYLEGLADVRREMEKIDPDHSLLGMTDTMTAVYEANFESALESARWTYEAMGRPPFFLNVLAYINAARGEYATAREFMQRAKPDYFSRDTWRKAMQFELQDACFVSWLLIATGDEQMGADLARTALAYANDELPQFIDHADRYTTVDCYMLLGDTEGALSSLETSFGHRHYGGWWFMRILPIYEPLWGEPRFEAVMAKVESDVAQQRERIARLAAERAL